MTTAVRTKPPDRRRNWTQKVKMEGQKFYACFGENADGRLVEVFLDASKQGTFVRGIMDALARVLSVSLQCGVPLIELVGALRKLNFPPQGSVHGSAISEASSVTDWLAQEIEQAYLAPKSEKKAGIKAEEWRTGA